MIGETLECCTIEHIVCRQIFLSYIKHSFRFCYHQNTTCEILLNQIDYYIKFLSLGIKVICCLVSATRLIFGLILLQEDSPVVFVDIPEDMHNSLRVCLDGGFKMGREGRVYILFLNYGHYKMFFKKLTY